VKRRDLIAALERAGFELARSQGKHDVYVRASAFEGFGWKLFARSNATRPHALRHGFFTTRLREVNSDDVPGIAEYGCRSQ